MKQPLSVYLVECLLVLVSARRVQVGVIDAVLLARDADLRAKVAGGEGIGSPNVRRALTLLFESDNEIVAGNAQ